jgi:hypothetical protein
MAGLLIPAEGDPTLASPALVLLGQPGFGPFFSQLVELGKDIEMVYMPIAVECLEPLTRGFGAQPAVRNAFAVRAGSDLALRAARVNVEHIRPAALACEPGCRPPLTTRFFQQVAAICEGCAEVVAGPTVETTRSQQTKIGQHFFLQNLSGFQFYTPTYSSCPNKPICAATATAAARESTPSLLVMLARWALTVRSLMSSRAME